MKQILIVLFSVFLVASCNSDKNELLIEIQKDVINANYLGNGAQWDPYCEAELWGAPMTDKEWEIVFKRVGFMKMSLVRCMINSPLRYYDATDGSYKRDRNIESLKKMLEFCQKNNITVMFGEFNSPTPQMRTDQKWISMAVNYLNYLVIESGYTCIKYYIPCNEPDGDWSIFKGDYDEWRKMMDMFKSEINKYPALAAHISFASPDAVMNYTNPNSKFGTIGWVENTAKEIDSIVGIYDVHTYPGQYQVISGQFTEEFINIQKVLPKNKRLVLGEAGFKTWRKEDSLLNKIHLERLANHPMIANKANNDCNMLVYEFVYGLDMPILAMEVMNNGGAGMAVWMLDDTHTYGDKGDTANVKVWGMWNILGGRVWNRPEEEQIRPWYYTWSLMCRYFNSGTDILKIKIPESTNIKAVAGIKDGKLSIAVINYGLEDYFLNIQLPLDVNNGVLYRYEKENMAKDIDGLPVPSETGISAKGKIKLNIKAGSFLLLTGQNY